MCSLSVHHMRCVQRQQVMLQTFDLKISHKAHIHSTVQPTQCSAVQSFSCLHVFAFILCFSFVSFSILLLDFSSINCVDRYTLLYYISVANPTTIKINHIRLAYLLFAEHTAKTSSTHRFVKWIKISEKHRRNRHWR